MSEYRENILALAEPLLGAIDCSSALDFGCGDGWFAARLPRVLRTPNITPIDVLARPQCVVDPIIYDGGVLPFRDHQFELCYAIDVLHHCADPEKSLRDLIRCTGRYLFIKDHTFRSPFGYAALCLLDELGNRRFGVPSLYRYQRHWSWIDMIEANGMQRLELVAPAPVHRGLLGAATNCLQFIGLWERS